MPNKNNISPFFSFLKSNGEEIRAEKALVEFTNDSSHSQAFTFFSP